MSLFVRSLAVFFAIALGACAGAPPARYSFDENADFSAYRSFAWLSDDPLTSCSIALAGEDRETRLRVLSERVRREIGRALETRGLVPAARDEADLIVSYNISARGMSEWEAEPRFHDTPRDRCTAVGASTFTKALLEVSVIERGTARALWDGAASEVFATVPPSDEAIRAGVERVLANFPPPG